MAVIAASLALAACAANPYAGIALSPGAADPVLQAEVRRALAGDKTAQLALGVRYETGDGVVVDYARAEQLYRQAAEGAPSLGYVYSPAVGKESHGRQVPVRIRTGALSETGAIALNRLGRMYLDGRGVPKDYEKGKLLIEKAAQPRTLTGRLTRGPNIGVDPPICQDARKYYLGYFDTKTVGCRAYAENFVHEQSNRQEILYDLSIDLDEEASEAMHNDGYGPMFVEGTTIVSSNLDMDLREECGRFRVRDMIVEDRRYPIIIGILNEDHGGKLVTGYVGRCKDD